MAKLDMQLVRIFASKRDKKDILTALQEMAAFDLSATDPAPREGFYRENEEYEALNKLSASADSALSVLGRVVPESKPLLSAFSGRRKISSSEFFSAEEKADDIMKACDEIFDLEREKAEIKAEIIKLKVSAEQLGAYSALDLPLGFSGTEKTVAAIGTIPGSFNLEELCEKIAQTSPELDVYAEIVGAVSGQTVIFATTDKKQEEKFFSALREMGFSRPSVSGQLPPKEEIKRIEEKERLFEARLTEIDEKIASFAPLRRDIELISDWYLSKALCIEAQNGLDNSKHTVIITGYIPTVDFPLLKEKLKDKFTVHIENEQAGEDAPVKLKGNRFTEPAQSITSMYALPSAADIDPTPITSFFYYLLFGIMLSDAGYGLLMWIATWAVNKFLDPEPNMRKNMKLFMYCGISTTLWGLFFGSFFGIDIITIISQAITGQGLPFKYPFINPLNGDALAMLILSVALGFVQIIAGLLVKFYITLKSDGLMDAVLDIGLWITTLFGFGIFAVGLVVLPILQTIGLIVAAASMLGIVVFGGRKKKGAMKFIGGLASLYDITGYVSDLLSFSRLMALGLTTSAMSMVFNTLGEMVSGGIIGKFFMLAILLVGHAVNFGLNALGAYVHTLRLQYVELFSKFYEGGGRAFAPFAFKGKYIRIKEEK